MKNILAISIVIVTLISCKSTFNLGQCEELYFDLNKGTLNGIKGIASIDAVKKAFPCFTGESEEGKIFNCGGGVFYLKHDFYFYTFNDYIEIRKDFKGQLSKNVLNNSVENLYEIMGKPDEIIKEFESTNDIDTKINYYQKSWGTIAFKEKNTNISEVQLYYGKKIFEIDYCN